jgi:hypothetical protein
VALHANTVAQNRAAAKRTGRINGDNANRLFALAIFAGHAIHQRAFACARRSSKADNPRRSTVREQGFQQFGGIRQAILHGSNSARQRPQVAPADTFCPVLNVFRHVHQDPVKLTSLAHTSCDAL